MSDLQVTAVSAPPPIAPIRPIAPPKPPKTQSDHEAANPTTSSRGPAVVLSGAVAKPPERHGQGGGHRSAEGHHVDRVI
jgi:hypothetical protein